MGTALDCYAVAAHQRLECEGADELRQRAGEGHRRIEHLEPGERHRTRQVSTAFVHDEHSPHLPRERAERLRIALQLALARLEDVVHRTRPRLDVQRLGLLGDAPPDVPLVRLARTARTQRVVHLPHLRGPRVGEERSLAGAKRLRHPAPAPLLDAGHRDLHPYTGGHQDREVQDPVLLRADELLAIEQEDVSVLRQVLERELRHLPLLRNLRHARLRVGQRLWQRQVVGLVGRRCLAGRHQRNHRQPAERLSRAGFEGHQGLVDVLHTPSTPQGCCSMGCSMGRGLVYLMSLPKMRIFFAPSAT